MTTAQQQPPPDDGRVSLAKFLGLRNTVSPERLQPNELAEAVNVDLDDRGQLHRRRGSTRVSTGSWHSLFATSKGTPIGVLNGTLGRVNPDFSFLAFGGNSSVGNDFLSYVQVADTVYFSSRSTSGKIALSMPPASVATWGYQGTDLYWYSPVVHPDHATLIPAQLGGIEQVAEQAEARTPQLPLVGGKLLGNVPLATCLAYYNGRIYLAQGNMLWATELFLYDFLDTTKNFRQFEAPITVIAAVKNGIYVGTSANLWYISGAFGEETSRRVYDRGVLPGTVAVIPEQVAHPRVRTGGGLETEVQPSLAMRALNTILLATDEGIVYDLTRDTFLFPDGQFGTTLFRQQDGLNQLISVVNSGGTPRSSARFSDYASATLVRANGEVVQ